MPKSKTAASAVSRDKYLYSKTSKGIDYLYFRMPPKGDLIPLPVDRNSVEFAKAYDKCVDELSRRRKAPAVVEREPEAEAIDTRVVKFVGDTIGAAIETYKSTSDYLGIKPSSKRAYDKNLRQLAGAMGMTRLRDLDTDGVDLYTDRIVRKIGAPTADIHRALLSNIWSACRPHPRYGLKGLSNPTRDAKRRTVKAKHSAKPWPDHVQEDFMRTAPVHLREGKLLLHFSAQRGGDAVAMQWRQFDGEGLFVVPEKGGELEAANWHKCPAPLLAMLKQLQKQRKPKPTDHILLNSVGQPWSGSGTLGTAIRDHLMKIGHAKRGTKTWSMHGLRKNAAVEVAGLFKGARGIKSVTGHKSDAMAEFYAQHAEQMALNREVVAAWDEKLAEKAKSKPKLRRVK